MSYIENIAFCQIAKIVPLERVGSLEFWELHNFFRADGLLLIILDFCFCESCCSIFQNSFSFALACVHLVQDEDNILLPDLNF